MYELHLRCQTRGGNGIRELVLPIVAASNPGGGSARGAQASRMAIPPRTRTDPPRETRLAERSFLLMRMGNRWVPGWRKVVALYTSKTLLTTPGFPIMFGRLLPKEGRFFDLFNAHAA